MSRKFAWRMGVWIFGGLAVLAGWSTDRAGALPQSKDALTRAEVIELLDAGVPPKRVEILVKERGITFELTREAEAALRRAGATASLIETLRSLAGGGGSGPAVLMVESKPGGAQVFVDDELIARTSAEGRLKVSTLSAGRHAVRISLEGHPDFEESVELQAGKTVTITADFEAARATPAVLVIESTPGKAAVLVDDEFIARTSSEGRLKISTIPAGRHRVRVTADKYSDFERTVDLVAGKTVTVTANLVAASSPPPAPGRKAGTLGTGKKDGMKYVWIPPGTYMMGCSPGDSSCWDNENPAHRVTISRGFWMGQTEVTVDAYRRYLSETGKDMPGEPEVGGIKKNPGWRYGNYPMVAVRWDEAQAYCTWAGGRLPTDAEWEYAARAGTTTARYGPLNDIAWSGDNSGPNIIDAAKLGREAGDKYTERLSALGNTFHPVAQKLPNAWGLYDTIGSVWEWVNDWYDEKYYSRSPEVDPPGPASGTERVERGGSWISTAPVVRLSRRDSLDHTSRWTDVGFRCAIDAAKNAVSAAATPPPESGGRKAGTTGTGKKDGLKYVWIPPGTFTMGCSPSDNMCWDNEIPAHQVTITKGFWIGQTEVTVDAYRRYLSETGKDMPGEPEVGGIKKNPGWRYGNYPMVAVRWDEAQAYCTWAGGRLPTDAEWEYAARAGTTTPRYGALNDIAWSADNSGPNLIDSAKIGREAGDKYVERISALGNTFHPVAQKAPNAWGLYDTIGSVWEWVHDWYDEKYFSYSPSVDPQGPARGSERVERGGSWLSTPAVVRLSRRDSLDGTSRWTDVGFRCALDQGGQ